MSSQQPSYPTRNKGTLVPGQTIAVNKYTVQVERYLSKGGFAHVYLVRTATPVYNTTHHVLKHIAVSNDTMLAEVKKEVDIMRLLKGHPNIVHLIDASWRQMSNGMYEVFILMEFCPGGGIIDMMNRRLRERLTEAEILQIFVDVCEGVACMHNLHPALLHRDLKVENILQSSPNSFKLCDFGSATTVTRTPTTTQEIWALEADLNRHTTLQYRAPEMVDLYQRRPVDEKSDVWALGVLLYKLCYYTTPFEEHGPLAILNVQYRIPPYPVYSPQINQLIGTMLQEHGVRRPSVFELLDRVHHIRGTKPRFKYAIPTQQPLSRYHPHQLKTSQHSIQIENSAAAAPQPLLMSVTPSRAERARDPVIGAIIGGKPTLDGVPHLLAGSSNTRYYEPQVVTPMRRGRPDLSRNLSTSRPSSPQQPPELLVEKGKNWLGNGITTEEDKAWRTSVAENAPHIRQSPQNAWKVGEEAKDAERGNYGGFHDDFDGKSLDAFGKADTEDQDDNTIIKPTLTRKRASPSLAIDQRSLLTRERDAFDGLGLSLPSQKPAPTLGEARKLRTGLAIMSTNGNLTDGRAKATLALTPSPHPPHNLSVSARPPSLKSPPQAPVEKIPPARCEGISVESRFPSLEEIDANFSPKSTSKRGEVQGLQRNENIIHPTVDNAILLKPGSYPRGAHSRERARSEQVTDIPMRGSASGGNESNGLPDGHKPNESKSVGGSVNLDLKPRFLRRDRSSTLVKPVSSQQISVPSTIVDKKSALPSPGPAAGKSIDWMTGDDDKQGSPFVSALASPGSLEVPILRDSPSKRASVITQKGIIPTQDVVIANHDEALSLGPKPTISSDLPTSPRLSRFNSAFPPIDMPNDTVIAAGQHRSMTKHTSDESRQEPESASSADEGPEDAAGSRFLRAVSEVTGMPPKRRGRKARQSSVHDLVDLYGGGVISKDNARDKVNREEVELTPYPQRAPPLVSPLHQAKPPTTPSNLQTASPNGLLSPININTSGESTGGDVQHNQSTFKASALSPSRSRPQSMFLFPSKSTNAFSSSSATSSPLVSTGLAPPEEIKRPRRTSISDIVQHFEGMGGSAKVGGLNGPALSAIQKPVGRVRLTSTDGGAIFKGRSGVEKGRVGPLLVPGDSTSVNPPPRSPTRASSSMSQTAHVKTSTPVCDTPPEDTIPRNTSLKPVSNLHASTDDSSSLTDGGSSPSDRPYQGVGKLIEQWQRKTVEANSSRTPIVPKRGAFVVKRASVIQNPPG